MKQASIAGRFAAVTRRDRAAALAAAIGLLAACGTAQSVRPLGRGRSAMDASVGGPMLAADATDAPVAFPFPLLFVGYRRGLDDRSDAFGRLHLVPALFSIVGVELGASRLLIPQNGPVPALGMNAEALVVWGAGGAFVVPAASLNASWSTGPWLWYVGTEQAVSFGRRLEGRGAAFHWAPYVGATRQLGRWTVGAELRWWEPHVGDDAVLIYWQGIGGRGALAPMFSIERRFGGDS